MDFEVQRCTRHCAASGKTLEPGDTFYSVLSTEGGNIVRADYAIDAWQGPPEGALGWWKSQIPPRNARKLHWAPNDVMLHLLDELADEPPLADMRYVLGLLLVRRRVVRLEETETDPAGRDVLVLYSPKTEATHRIPVVTPSEKRIEEIQDELARLLFGGAS